MPKVLSLRLITHKELVGRFLVSSRWNIPDPPIGLCNILTIQSHWQLTGHQFSIVSLKTLLVTTDPSSGTPKNHVTPLPSPPPP